MATVGTSCRVLCNGHDLSRFLREASASVEVDALDSTTFGDTKREYTPGLRDGSLSAGGLHDSDTDSPVVENIDAVVNAAVRTSGSLVTVFPAGASVGSRGFGQEGVQTSFEVEAPLDELVACTFESTGKTEPVVALHDAFATAESADDDGTSVDNGSATSNGAVGYLHVIDVAGTTPEVTVKVQHSADDVTYADLITFSAVDTDFAAQRVEVAGTVNRYLRATWALTGTGPSAKFVVAAGRL